MCPLSSNEASGAGHYTPRSLKGRKERSLVNTGWSYNIEVSLPFLDTRREIVACCPGVIIA
jgi:hypothetical protein